MSKTIEVPVPLVEPFGLPLDSPEFVREVWDAFVVPDQEAGVPPSVEMRLLMAILRSFYKGLEDRE